MPKSYVKLKRCIQDALVDLTSQEKPNMSLQQENIDALNKDYGLNLSPQLQRSILL